MGCGWKDCRLSRPGQRWMGVEARSNATLASQPEQEARRVGLSFLQTPQIIRHSSPPSGSWLPPRTAPFRLLLPLQGDLKGLSREPCAGPER